MRRRHHLLLLGPLLLVGCGAEASTSTTTARPSPAEFQLAALVEPAPPPTATAAAVSPTSPTTTRPPTPPMRVPHRETPHASRGVVGAGAEAFRRCVMLRESGNGRGSSNLYGFLPATWRALGRAGRPGDASEAEQTAAFWELYARAGVRPWRPYDGC